MSPPVRIAMIGAGRHSSRMLYPNLRKLVGCEVVAACDLDAERAAAVAAVHGITATFDDWRAMLETAAPDGVIVCVGDRSHARLAVDLMEAGCHVFVEKPHAPDLERSLAMLETARRRDRVCMAGYKKRYAPAYREAKALIDGWERLSRLSISRSMGGNDKQDPGYLWQWGCHAIDLVDHLAGPPEEVMAWRTAADWAAVSCVLRFPHGGVGELSLASPGANWEQVVAHGSGMDALRVWDGLELTSYHGNSPCGGIRPAFTASNDGDALMGFVGELQAFVDAIATGQRPASDILAASRTVALYEAMERSLASGAPERVATVEEPASAAAAP